MKYSELENELDEYLAQQSWPESDKSNVGIWPFALKAMEKDLAEEFETIDKITMMRMLAKCVVAYDKRSHENEENRKWAASNIESLERLMSERINLFRDEMKTQSDDWIFEAEKNVLKKTAKNAALVRHIPTYEKRDAIIAYWRENIGAEKSNEFAAELLQKKFPEVSHRTLARYVSIGKNTPC